MAYQFSIHPMVSDGFNKELSAEQQAQIKAAAEAEYNRYVQAYTGGTRPLSDWDRRSAENGAMEFATRQFEGIMTQRSNDMMAKQVSDSNTVNAWLDSQRGSTGIQEIPEQYKSMLSGGDYVLNNGVLTQRSAISEEAANEAAVKAGTMIKVPIGSGFGYVPTGSAGAANMVNMGTNNTANAANAINPEVIKKQQEIQGMITRSQTLAEEIRRFLADPTLPIPQGIANGTSANWLKQGINVNSARRNLEEELNDNLKEVQTLNNQMPNTGQPMGSTQGTQGTQYNLGNTTLSIGSKDKNAVMELQKALNASGVGVNLKVDGLFGPATEAAVRAYQAKNNLKVDGIVGPQTKGQLSGTPTSLSPAYGAITNGINSDPQKSEIYNSLTPELKSLFDQLTLQISTLVEQGQRVNPDLTITPEMTARFLEQATKELDPYYQELIRQNKQDLSTSFQQLQEDYNKTIQREQPAFQQTLEGQDINEAEAGMAFSSGRQKREQNIISGQQQRLDDLFQINQRGAEKLAVTGERQIGSRAFGDLGIPSLQQYAAQRSTISPRGTLTSTGSRSLYAPQTGLFGELPAQAKTAIDTRTSALEEAERKKRILDSGVGLGSTSLG
jgi:peptidoglycan hydrolase-like protein with peptidoglycan-binding domain